MGRDLPDTAIRLNLGCGNKRPEGYINVDFADNTGSRLVGGREPDVVADIRALPFPDNYADEAMAIHVIEHFWVWEVPDILAEWLRVLKPGGKLAIECPSLVKVLALAQVPQCPPNLTYWALFGDPRHKDPRMMHKWCYGPLQLIKMVADVGFEDVAERPPKFHEPVRDMRIIARKPAAMIEVAQ